MTSEKTFYKIEKRQDQKPSALRRSGFIPGVIYGGRLESGQPIQISRQVAADLLKNNTKSSVIDVDLDGDKGSVIVREVQRHGSTGDILHIDLQAVRKDEILTLEVPLVILGEEELAHRRLIVNQNLSQIQIKGPADRIPETITLDLTGRMPDEKPLAGDIELAEGVELVTPADELLVTISESRMSQDLEQLEEAAPEPETAPTEAQSGDIAPEA
ncbi:50S ribosomal protein L25 [Proteiniclasticum sp. QWL-01]|uniref:50S ribosomal protein L25 n=1 Tax=Proteiniclasticum sp. QWL-01 TaxID=3036945 RepID=UPI00240FF94F|nr:50S ribosomal protein L25 [Proteiniclasticum sp. QWL-01]WFF73051.1 50S ribosomal protein L25 [Proteiniclasticum sp. QWL-01]